MISPPRLSVVICTRDRAGLLGRTLASLAAQTLDRSAFEVIVVDDGSTDETRAAVDVYSRSLDVRYAYQRHAGLASGKNHGLFLSRGMVVLFQDDDDLATPTLLEEHLRTHDAHPEESVAVLANTRLDPSIAGDPLMHFVTEVGCYLFAYPGLADGAVLDFEYFWGGRTSCKRAFLVERGVFNQVFQFGCEDIELGYRLSAFGLRVVYNARAIGVMVRSLTFDGFCDRLVRQGRSNFVFSQLHGDSRVQQWTEVAGSESRWRTAEGDFDLIVWKARRLDLMARRKRELGFDLEPLDVTCLHEAYRAAFQLCKLKGIMDAHGRVGRPPAVTP
jgi:glycosyltransferase involved in cell wall biosynthesis